MAPQHFCPHLESSTESHLMCERTPMNEAAGIMEERRAAERRRLHFLLSSPNISLICTSEGGIPAFRGAGLRVHVKIGVTILPESSALGP